MATVNKVILVGRLTADPELRVTPNGTSVATANIAVNDGFGDNQKSYFFNLEAWTHTAEYIATYAKKGMKVTVEGKLQQQTWEADGGKRSKVVVRVDNMELPDKPKDDGKSSPFGLGEEIVFEDIDLPF